MTVQPTQSTVRDAPGGAEAAASFDLFDLPAGFFDDPYPWFRALRQHDPIHANADGSVLLTRYHDVKCLWRDLSAVVDKTEIFRRRFGEGPLLEMHTTAMLYRDPPDHDRLRAILNPFFAATPLEALRPFLESLVDDLLDRLAEEGGGDFVRQFSLRVPTAAICLLLGLPVEDGDYIHSLSEKILLPLNPSVPPAAVAAGHAAVDEFKAYLADHIDHARTVAPERADATMIGALVAARDQGGEISEEEIVHSCILMFNGGHSSTAHLLSMSLHALLEAPDQLEDLSRNPDILATAVEELIRYVTPIQLQGRRTTRPVTLPSGTLAPGTEAVICQASANHDEAVFADPERLDLRRTPNPHFAFGAGVHFCIGRQLARLEMRVVLPRLLARFENLERAGQAKFAPTARFRALATLPVHVRAA